MATNTMSKAMTKFWMESKISEDSRWHSSHEGDFRTEDRLADHFVGKLRGQCRHEVSNVAIMVRFTRMLKEQLESYESQANMLLKLADTGRVVVLLHKHIDIALDMLDILDPEVREEWHSQLLVERQQRLEVFEKFVKEDEQLVAALGDKNQQLQIVTLLRYCVEKYHDGLTKFAGKDEKYRDKLMVEELYTISMVYDLVVRNAGVVSGELPDWFVTSEHEWAWVNKAKLEDSKEAWGARAREKYIDTNLSEEGRGEVCEEVCVRLASIWTELNHPHLRKFYGASYVGKPFVIHETCFPPTYENDLWRYVSNCALGLQYVHDRGLVYYNLSPSTFLASYSERRGVVDGIGLVPRHDADRSRCLTSGSESSVSHDLLRFGISVFFLLAGSRNSNLSSDERDKTFDTWKYEATLKLPETRPQFINDEEWGILQGLCAQNPTERLGLVDAEYRMKLLASNSENPASTEDDQSSQERINLSDYKYSGSDLMTPAEMLDECEMACKDIDNHERAMDKRVLVRFKGMYKELEKSPMELTQKLLEDFCSLLWRFHQHVNKDDLDECTASASQMSRTVANMRSKYHYQIDQLIRSSPLLQPSGSDSCHQWHPTWEQDHEHQYAFFQACSDNPERFLEKVTQEQWPEEALAFMRFEVLSRAGAYSPDTVKKMKLVLQQAASRAKGVQQTNLGEPLPKWFVMNYQVELGDYLSEGGFASVHYGKWFGTDVVVKLLNSTEDREKFRKEADLWFNLNHSNLIKLYGACYEGQQPFFVCERATRQTLVEYLEPTKGRRHETWFRLLQAALGLEHLHDNNIVHGDLKGNNILVCDGGATKIADFGLSILATPSATSEDVETTCAVRWQAPECLEGKRPTFASDIYAFGMCIFEAVAGKYPWGTIPDTAVAHKVKAGEMCARPADKFQDYEWELVERMCRSDPEKRIGIGAVIKILEDIGVRKLMTSAGMIGPTTVDRKVPS